MLKQLRLIAATAIVALTPLTAVAQRINSPGLTDLPEAKTNFERAYDPAIHGSITPPAATAVAPWNRLFINEITDELSICKMKLSMRKDPSKQARRDCGSPSLVSNTTGHGKDSKFWRNWDYATGQIVEFHLEDSNKTQLKGVWIAKYNMLYFFSLSLKASGNSDTLDRNLPKTRTSYDASGTCFFYQSHETVKCSGSSTIVDIELKQETYPDI